MNVDQPLQQDAFWHWAQRLGLTALLLALLALAPHLFDSTERVRLRNALVLQEDARPELDWTVDQAPPSFKRESLPAASLFQARADALGLKMIADPWERALAIASHLLRASPVLSGEAIQSDLQGTYLRITERGEGYCGDFVRSFMALAHAAGLQTRAWGFAFDGFGGHGHIWVEIWNARLSRWQLLDVFNNAYFTLNDQPLSAIEMHQALLSRDPALRMHRIDSQARPGYAIEAKAWDYYHRGESQWYQLLGDNLESYDSNRWVRVSAYLSRSLEQLAAIAAGVYPGMAVWQTEQNREAFLALRSLRQRLSWLAGVALAGLSLLSLATLMRRRLQGPLTEWRRAHGHVLLVGPLPPPVGGMANQCEQLLRLLRAEGLNVHLLRTNPPYWPAWIGRIPVLRALPRLLAYVLVARREIRGARIVHIMANSGWAWHLLVLPVARLALARQVPLIINYRGGLADEFLSEGPRHVRRLLARADLRVVPSSFLQRVFAKQELDAVIIPNIIDLSRFKQCPLRDFGAAPVLLVARNLELIYDNATAIRAFAHLRAHFPEAQLIVAGEGPELARLKALCTELGVTEVVEFVGRVSNTDMPALYQRSHCFLNASTVDNMPISILEAFASGVPVVSTDAGGIPDLVENGRSGLLVPIGDALSMATAARRLLADAALAERLRAAGLQEAGRYSWSCVKHLWLAAYEGSCQVDVIATSAVVTTPSRTAS